MGIATWFDRKYYDTHGRVDFALYSFSEACAYEGYYKNWKFLDYHVPDEEYSDEAQRKIYNMISLCDNAIIKAGRQGPINSQPPFVYTQRIQISQNLSFESHVQVINLEQWRREEDAKKKEAQMKMKKQRDEREKEQAQRQARIEQKKKMKELKECERMNWDMELDYFFQKQIDGHTQTNHRPDP